MTASAELPIERVTHVARYARGALAAADALGVVPTPLDAVRQALKLHDPEELYDLSDAPPGLLKRIRSLAGKVLGAIAIRERVVLLDRSQSYEKQRFSLGHELGHDALPWHQDAYFADDRRTLDPDTHLELEAEANAFSAELLFNLGEFSDRAHASRIGLASAIELADVFETSRQAAIRRYVEDSPRECALLFLGRYFVHPRGRRSLKVLRAIESQTFRDRFGPAASLLPSAIPVDADAIGVAAVKALKGVLADPVTTGEYVLLDSRRGAQRMTFEVYSNTYFAFALLYPARRHVLRKQIRLQWTPTATA